MATEDGYETPSVADDLFTRPYDYEFHQAIKILEQLYPERSAYGHATNPCNDIVFVSSRVSYTYPASDIYSLIKPSIKENTYRLQVNFLGLAGANAPLPMPYADLLIRQNQQNSTAYQDFMDIFNNRLLSLLHRIRKKYWPGLANNPLHEGSLYRLLNALNGSQRGDQSLLPSSPLHNFITMNTIHYWRKPRSTAALKAMISDYFQMPVIIESNRGQWNTIGRDQQTQLGMAHSQLGFSATVGECYWDQMTLVLINLGPLTWSEFQTFMPTGSAWPLFISLVKSFLDTHNQFQICLVIKSQDVQPMRLGDKSYLGWNSWLHGRSHHALHNVKCMS